MESVNYTYEKKSCRKTGKSSLGWHLGLGYVQKILTIKYESWVVIDKNGRKFAEVTSEKNAQLIVAALNGVAP